MDYSHDDYTIGWICALPLEMTAASGMLDEEHPSLSQPKGDTNTYTLGAIAGSIGKHNVVIACLPAGSTGTASAANTATIMQTTFKSLRFSLMVGIGGGVPSEVADIRLGDVVVSQPTKDSNSGGVVQFDFGKTIEKGRFQRTGTLNKPPPVLMTAVSKLQSIHGRQGHTLHSHMEHMWAKFPKTKEHFIHQGQGNDELFKADYDHLDKYQSCSACGCDRANLIPRKSRQDSSPEIHYGLIASGNQVMKHGLTRDKLRDQEGGILCFEMEAAGLMDYFSSFLVIRGICDYSDTHKNKIWQEFAATTAAAFAKELLSIIAPQDVEKSSKARYAAIAIVKEDLVLRKSCEEEVLLQLEFPGMQQRYEEIRGSFKDTFQWIFEKSDFTDWLSSRSGVYWITGKPGSGKSTLTKLIYDDPKTLKILQDSTPPRFKLVLAGFFFHESERSENNSLLRSQQGLLRAIFHQVLQKFPQLSESIFPDLWNRTQHYLMMKRTPPPYEWSLGKLKTSFQNLLYQKVLQIRLCLIIDGLDEFEGDDTHLIETLGSVHYIQKSSSTQVQLLVSSRPEAVFENAFRHHLHLRIHELSEPDIKKFVTGKLSEHPRTRYFDSEEASEMNSIALNVVRDSGGVFLWVEIIVRSLLDGLTDYESVNSLKSRCNDFPSDLNNLYGHLIDKIHKRYHNTSATIFRLLCNAETRITALLLYFALEGRVCSIDWSAKPLTESQVFKFEFQIKSQLQSCCAGLVDYIVPEPDGSSPPPFYRNMDDAPYVEFYHLTVKEFFKSNTMNIWLDNILGQEVVEIQLLSAYLQYTHRVPIVYLKLSDNISKPFHRYWIHDWTTRGLLGNFFEVCKNLKNVARNDVYFYLKAMDQILSKRYPWSKEYPHWTVYRISSRDYGSLLLWQDNYTTFLLQLGFDDYVIEQIKTKKYDLFEWRGRPLLSYAISGYNLFGLRLFDNVESPEHFSLKVIGNLLDRGCDPNQTFDIYDFKEEPASALVPAKATVWEAFCGNLILQYFRSSKAMSSELSLNLLREVELLLQHGAEATASFPSIFIASTDDGTTFKYKFVASTLSLFYFIFEANSFHQGRFKDIVHLFQEMGASYSTYIKGPKGISELDDKEFLELYRELAKLRPYQHSEKLIFHRKLEQLPYWSLEKRYKKIGKGGTENLPYRKNQY